ncbi:MAG: hypothetical protein JJT89_06625 [Nitriliruptoraceae bacterium]|nr:hypothetical protein [Nitriliruptoraceae bacterium]
MDLATFYRAWDDAKGELLTIPMLVPYLSGPGGYPDPSRASSLSVEVTNAARLDVEVGPGHDMAPGSNVVHTATLSGFETPEQGQGDYTLHAELLDVFMAAASPGVDGLLRELMRERLVTTAKADLPGVAFVATSTAYAHREAAPVIRATFAAAV